MVKAPLRGSAVQEALELIGRDKKLSKKPTSGIGVGGGEWVWV